MCNLYSMTKNVDAIRRLFKVDPAQDRTGNMPLLPGIYPDYPAPIVRNRSGGRELAMARWGMPSSQRTLMDATKKRAQKLEAKGKPVDFKELLRMEPDSGTTNIRNVSSAHWKRWLGPEHRCLAPFTSFSEYDTVDGKKVPVWFAADENRPLMCFAGLWTNWTSVRKVKEGEVTADIFAFLTCEPNAEVGRVHPKAMPVVLTRSKHTMSGCGRHGTRPSCCRGRFRTARCGSWRPAKRKTRHQPPSGLVHSRPRNKWKTASSDDSESLPCVSSRNDRWVPRIPVAWQGII